MQELFLELAKLSLIGSLFSAVVILLRFVFRKAPKWVFCVLWGMVALRLICPFSVESNLSLVPDNLANGQILSNVEDTYIGRGETIEIYDNAVPEGNRQPIGSLVTEEGTLQPAKTIGNTVFPVLGWIWLAGMILMFVYTAVSYLTLYKKMEEATHLQDNIWQCEQVDTPFVLGFIKPRIYLPYAISDVDMANVIAHEQAHIHRKDHWWKPIGFLILSVHWFNPILWLAYILLCRDIEAACDEKVVKHMGKDEVRAYSTALLNYSIQRRRIAACPLAFGEVGVKERVKSVMNYKKPALWIIVAAVITGAVVAVCLFTDPMGSGYSRVQKITNQEGYSIVEQEMVPVTLSLSTADLPQSIYTEAGCEFEDGQIIVYDDGTNQIYLKGVRYSNEGIENLYFYFEFAYDLPRDGGQLLYPSFIKEDGITYATFVEAGTLRTETGEIENAVHFRGQDSGERQRIWFYVSTDAIKQIGGAFSFDVRVNQITYLRDGAASETLTGDHAASSENNESLLSSEIYMVDNKTGEIIDLGKGPMTADQLISFFVNGGKEMLDGPVNQNVHIAKRDVQQKATIHSIVVNTASVTFRYTYGADAVQEPGEFGDVKVVLTDGTVINGLGPYGVPGDNGEFISTYATTKGIPVEDIDYVQVGETIVAIPHPIIPHGNPMIPAP